MQLDPVRGREVHVGQHVVLAAGDCQEFRVWAGSCTLRCFRFDEPFVEQDGEWGLCHGPFTRWDRRAFF